MSRHRFWAYIHPLPVGERDVFMFGTEPCWDRNDWYADPNEYAVVKESEFRLLFGLACAERPALSEYRSGLWYCDWFPIEVEP